MLGKPSYVSTVSLVPAETGSQSPEAGEWNHLSTANSVYLPTYTGIKTPPVAQSPDRDLDRSDPFRITNIRFGDASDELDQEQYIRDEESRVAQRKVNERQQWSWTVTTWNITACVLCPICWYCMLGSLLCNIFAYVDHKSNDFASERVKLRCSLWWSVAGFVAGVIAIIVILVVLFVVYGAQNWNSIPTLPGSDFTM